MYFMYSTVLQFFIYRITSIYLSTVLFVTVSCYRVYRTGTAIIDLVLASRDVDHDRCV